MFKRLRFQFRQRVKCIIKVAMSNNLYWNVYKSLERELLTLAEIIHIDDVQLDVYSMKILHIDILLYPLAELKS